MEHTRKTTASTIDNIINNEEERAFWEDNGLILMGEYLEMIERRLETCLAALKVSMGTRTLYEESKIGRSSYDCSYSDDSF